MMGPSALSTTVVNRALRTVPYPLLGENTLVLSDTCILAPDDEGNMALMFRCAAVRPTLQTREKRGQSMWEGIPLVIL